MNLKRLSTERCSEFIYRLCSVLLSLLLICNFGLSAVYSKYVVNSDVSIDSPLQNYIFDISKTADGTEEFSLDLSYLNYVPGQGFEENWVVFYITNKTNNSVPIEYTITAESMGNISFGFTILSEGDTVNSTPVSDWSETNDGIGTLASGLPLGGGVTKTAGTMPAGEVAVHKYVMQIYTRGRAEDKHSSYAGTVDWVTLSVSAKQSKPT